jgi:hypothetical protein
MKNEVATATKASKTSQKAHVNHQPSGAIAQTQGAEPSSPERYGPSAPEEEVTKKAEEAAETKHTKYLLIGGGIFLVVFLIGVIVLLASFPKATQVVRDIAIVFVAVETFLIGLALLVLVVQTEELIRVLRDEIQPLLRSVNDTAATVKGTTNFVSHNMVSPIIRVAGFTAGVTASLRRVADDLRVVVGAAQARQDGVRKSTNTYTGGMENE